MLDRLLEALLTLLIRWYRDHKKQGEFKDVAEETRALLESLEKSAISDEEKNEIFNAQMVRLLSARNKLRE